MSTSATAQNGQRDAAAAGVQSVDRALNILEVLARVGEAGVTEVGTLQLEAVAKTTGTRWKVELDTRALAA